jgi:predicted alpha/beta-fold hydrolase
MPLLVSPAERVVELHGFQGSRHAPVVQDAMHLLQTAYTAVVSVL